ncbi:MAG TPA: sigma-70 family RNA polymerase sigma factor [Acidimicrobiales bacterium]|nr:sigma-70 family RNA polymerase sigma factor [Acidimicrobiales bacterium]
MGAADEAFREAFTALYPSAGRVAFRILGDQQAAEDVAAEALARAYERWPKVSRLPYRDAWVLRVAANLAIDSTRRKRPPLRRARPIEIEEDAAVHLTLRDALAALSPRQREVVALRYLGDMSEADVAAALGLAAGSVKTHLRRGLENLRRTLGDDFGSGLVAI